MHFACLKQYAYPSGRYLLVVNTLDVCIDRICCFMFDYRQVANIIITSTKLEKDGRDHFADTEIYCNIF